MAYEYDADGNQVKAGAHTYRFDAQNRLTAMTQGTKTWATFTYDADGNRAKRDSTTRAWDINNSLPLLAAEYSSTGAVNSDYTYNPLGEIEYGHVPNYPTSAAVYYHRDLVGSITGLTTPSGTMAAAYDYTDAFGAGGPFTDIEAPRSNFGYTGQYKELIRGEEGTPTEALGYNLRARSYDQTTGRFTSHDPYTAGQDSPTGSSYAYVGNAPTNRFDPAGTCWWIPGSGKESCWTAEIPGTSSIPLSASMKWITNSYMDSCKAGAEYAKENGRWGWTGCMDEFTGMGSVRRGIYSFQQGDTVDGVAQCLGGVGQFGLLVLPGPKMGGGPGIRLAPTVVKGGNYSFYETVGDAAAAGIDVSYFSYRVRLARDASSIGKKKSAAFGELKLGNTGVHDIPSGSGKGNSQVGSAPYFNDHQFSGEKIWRVSDAEQKIFEQAARLVEESGIKSGTLTVGSSRPVCDSCQAVAAAFAARYPNIKVRLFSLDMDLLN
ncbi:RHS repeat-associated core domain-containing protein [Streptomyces sp. NPDC048340]|uniref:RHS repeat-associated core domain-containing protein n=1 Tax=Streptomyces sp. NPDC048340 TaxID=3365537 RepID=UPI00371C7163